MSCLLSHIDEGVSESKGEGRGRPDNPKKLNTTSILCLIDPFLF